jgi:hypothetical protein
MVRDFPCPTARLDIAHGDGQQAVALGFDDAERGRELEQRRLFAQCAPSWESARG